MTDCKLTHAGETADALRLFSRAFTTIFDRDPAHIRHGTVSGGFGGG